MFLEIKPGGKNLCLKKLVLEMISTSLHEGVCSKSRDGGKVIDSVLMSTLLTRYLVFSPPGNTE